MKKFISILSIVLKVLLVIGVITYLVFYMVAHNDTVDFTNNVFSWLSTPIGITGVSILGFGYITYKIISILPFSKVAKEKLQNELSEEKGKIKAYREEIANKVKQLNDTKQECINIVGGFKEKFDVLENLLLDICETTPNAKVKEIGKKYKANKENIEKEISVKYDLARNSIVNSIDTIICNYNSILKDIKEIKEKLYGKEETTNN